MNNEVKFNYKINQGCGNCRHRLDRNYGWIYCDLDNDAPYIDAMRWVKWSEEHQVHACGICDNWSDGI